VTDTVVPFPFRFVDQYVPRLDDALRGRLGVLVVADVGMCLFEPLAIGCLDVLSRSVLGDPQNVVVRLCH
jgi:hypothetical protein